MFEDVAILVNSKLLTPALAHYMFGYYAIAAASSEAFWTELKPELPYWSMFFAFAEAMRQQEAIFSIRHPRKPLLFCREFSDLRV